MGTRKFSEGSPFPCLHSFVESGGFARADASKYPWNPAEHDSATMILWRSGCDHARREHRIIGTESYPDRLWTMTASAPPRVGSPRVKLRLPPCANRNGIEILHKLVVPLPNWPKSLRPHAQSAPGAMLHCYGSLCGAEKGNAGSKENYFQGGC